MKQCDNCGGRVTPAFERMYKTPDGKLHACCSCAPQTRISDAVLIRGGYKEPDGEYGVDLTADAGPPHRGGQ